jgi:RHS repeat-associated protein
MQLASSARIPDGFMAAMRLGGEKPHQGLPGRNPALYQGPPVCNSTTALGLRGQAELNRIGSCSTGKERDTESGNDYFGARYYSSAMGRFMSPDKPFADQHKSNPQSWNLYSYTRNNPLRFVDDNGEAVKETSNTVYYNVSGKTATEAWNNAPAAAGLGGYRGNTDWSIGVGHYDFNRSLQTNNGTQTVTDTVTSGDVNLSVTITLPKWDGYSSASPEEQKQWDSLTGNLQDHEKGHQDIAEKNADSLDKSLPGTKASGTSDTVPDATKKADSALGDTLHDKQNTTVDNTRQQQQTYDKKTNHGDN